ncbi:MAG: hypothetical protein E7001_02820 [Coriobacteriaceae bacterium]|nr:hypothetical protein [Coriobacteriaceae bacterium]
MDAILSEVYSTVLPAAPFVIGAYVGVLLVFAVFAAMMWGKQKKTAADIEALREALDRREHES